MSERLNDEHDLNEYTTTSPERTSIEAVISRVRRSIEKAKDGDDLIRRVEVIRGFPATDFTALHRERVVGDIQRKFKELTDETLTKSVVRKMLEPTVDDLRSQMEGEPQIGRAHV